MTGLKGTGLTLDTIRVNPKQEGIRLLCVNSYFLDFRLGLNKEDTGEGKLAGLLCTHTFQMEIKDFLSRLWQEFGRSLFQDICLSFSLLSGLIVSQ